MNTIVLECPFCEISFELDVGDAGTELQCECGESFAAPTLDEIAVAEEVLVVECPECESDLELAADAEGSQVECPCGRVFTVPSDSEPSDSELSEFIAPDLPSQSSPSQDVMPTPSLSISTETTTTSEKASSRISSKEKSQEQKKKQPVWLWPGIGAAVIVVVVVIFAALPSNDVASAPEPAEEATEKMNKDETIEKERAATTPNVIAASKDDPITYLPPFTRVKQTTSSSAESTNADGGQSEASPEKTSTKTKTGRDKPKRTPSNLPSQEPRAVTEFIEPEKPPSKFDTAHQAAMETYQPIPELEKKSSQSDSDLQAYRQQLAITGGLLHAAMGLVDGETDAAKLGDARHLLAYVYLQTGNIYEAGVVAQFITQYGEPQEEKVKEAAFIAMSAFNEIYLTAKSDDRTFELQALLDVARLINTNWPEHEKLEDIRLHAAQLSRLHFLAREAGDWYSMIPDSSPRYVESQLNAGRSYWDAHQDLQDADSPEAEELMDLALARLRSGIAAFDSAKASESLDSFYAAKLDLAVILLKKGQHDEVIKVITESPHSLVTAVEVKDPSSRPATGVKSRGFALLVYEILLRSFFERRQLDRMLEIGDEYDKLAGEDGTSRSTTFLVSVGKELLAEINATKDDTARRSKSQSLAGLLNDLIGRKESTTFGTLLWAAQASIQLAESSDQQDESAGYFRTTATAYRQAIDRGLVDERSALGVKVQLAKCQLRCGEYDAAASLCLELLAEQPNIYDLQMEAAYALQLAGINSRQREKLLEAIQGLQSEQQKPAIWGWGKISSTMQKQSSKKENDSAYRDRFFESRYNISLCRWHYARLLSDRTKMMERLEKAEVEISTLSKLYPSRDSEWWKRIDHIYQRIQRDLGKSPKSVFDSSKPDSAATSAA